ncbi:MAG: tRNA guanosine(15) transglycosylase TgtA [Crenarchaeota archaeon]|nr:tRNA guanosine(15) transglycosylase TgtA [Thermoproteota archaeon]
MIGLFEEKDVDLAARIGRLKTPRGWLETPALLPVIDPARQEVSPEEIIQAGFKAVITNAYLAMKRLGKPVDIHEAIGFKGIVMTDSGAYQLLRYGRVEATNKEIIEYEKRINTDIAVILDVPTGTTRDRREAEESVHETLRRAREALQYIDPDKRVWTLPIQGGPFKDLVEYSARESAKLAEHYQLYALGSPTVLLERYSYSDILDMIYTTRKIIPRSHPLHLFGAGHPMIIPFAVALGVDLFDSASYILYARDDRYMTPTKTYRLKNLPTLPCSCPICIKHTPEDLMQLPKPERTRLLALHNLYVLRQVLNEVKTAIREGRLWELLEERSKAHPSIYAAFKRYRKYMDYIEPLSPRIKSAILRGVFIYDHHSALNPKIRSHWNRVTKNYRPRKCPSEAHLIPILPGEKPFTNSQMYRRLSKPGRHVIGYAPIIGPVPEELAETYPLSQFEAPYSDEVDEETARITAARLTDYIATHQDCYERIVIHYTEEAAWSRQIACRAVEALKEKGIEATCTPYQQHQ